MGISLDLEGMGKIHQHGLNGHWGLVSTKHAREHHHLSSKAVNTAKVHVCTANNWAGKGVSKACGLPIAKAYDHHDGALKVDTHLLLVRSAPTNQGMPLKINKKCTQYPKAKEACAQKFIQWKQRAEYIVKYNAKDNSGNSAEQVVFAVILQDHVRPKIAVSRNKSFEAVKNLNHCHSNVQAWPAMTVTDNVDTRIGEGFKMSAKGPRAQRHLDTHTLGTRTAIYTANDFAARFGKSGRNNQANKVKASVKGKGAKCTLSKTALKPRTANPVNNMKTGA